MDYALKCGAESEAVWGRVVLARHEAATNAEEARQKEEEAKKENAAFPSWVKAQEKELRKRIAVIQNGEVVQ